MATLEGIKAKIRRLINSANAVTGNSDSDLTTAINTLTDGYGVGDSTGFYRYVTFMDADYETVASNVTVTPTYSCDSSVGPNVQKESTVDTVFKLEGWSLVPDSTIQNGIFDNITENITVYPVFKPSMRFYEIRFFDGDEVIHTDYIPYLGSSKYTYHKTGTRFQGWSPEPIDITADMDCHGIWEQASFATDSWSYIAEYAAAGTASEYYAVDDDRNVTLTYGDGSTKNIVMRIADLNNYNTITYADGDLWPGRKAGMVVLIKTPIEESKMAFSTTPFGDLDREYNRYGFSGSDVLKYLNEKILPYLPQDLLDVMPYTQLHYPYEIIGNVNDFSATITSKLFILSHRDVNSQGFRTVHANAEAYDIFKDDNTHDDNKPFNLRVVRLENGEAVPYWLLDVDSYDTGYIVNTDGSISNAKVHQDQAYVVFGFCL